MSFRVEISERAVADATAAFEYIADDAPMIAERWFDELMLAIDGLAMMPHGYPHARESGMVPGELRQMIHKPYRIIFSVEPGLVRVLHIRHTAMDRVKKRDARKWR